MSRDQKLYIDDIHIACLKITHFTQDMGRADFFADEKTQDAVIRNLEIIGEAVKNLPSSFRDRCTQIEWTKIARMRDYVAHAYFGVDLDIVWDVVENHIPVLLDTIESSR
jgi:uncharacterized protein with HEPN domain